MILSQSVIDSSSTAKTPNEKAVVSPRKLVTLLIPARLASGSGLITGVMSEPGPPPAKV